MKKFLLLILALQLGNTYAMESDVANLEKSLVSLSMQDKKQEKQQTPTAQANTHNATPLIPFARAYVSPNLKEVLFSFINAEQESIRGAFYRITLYDIAQKLCEKQNATPKIPVTLYVDKEFTDDFCAALRLMVKNGIPIFCNIPRRNDSNGYEVMHHKFFIFNNNMYHHKLLWTGSFNITGAANKNNWENVTVTNDPAAIQIFEQEFIQLKQYSRPVTEQNLVCSKSKSPYGRAMNCIPNDVPN